MNFAVPKEFGGTGMGVLDACLTQRRTQLRMLGDLEFLAPTTWVPCHC